MRMKQGNFSIPKNTVIKKVMILTMMMLMTTRITMMTTVLIMMMTTMMNVVLPHWCARVCAQSSLTTHLTSYTILMQFSN